MERDTLKAQVNSLREVARLSILNERVTLSEIPQSNRQSSSSSSFPEVKNKYEEVQIENVHLKKLDTMETPRGRETERLNLIRPNESQDRNKKQAEEPAVEAAVAMKLLKMMSGGRSEIGEGIKTISMTLIFGYLFLLLFRKDAAESLVLNELLTPAVGMEQLFPGNRLINASWWPFCLLMVVRECGDVFSSCKNMSKKFLMKSVGDILYSLSSVALWSTWMIYFIVNSNLKVLAGYVMRVHIDAARSQSTDTSVITTKTNAAQLFYSNNMAEPPLILTVCMLILQFLIFFVRILLLCIKADQQQASTQNEPSSLESYAISPLPLLVSAQMLVLSLFLKGSYFNSNYQASAHPDSDFDFYIIFFLPFFAAYLMAFVVILSNLFVKQFFLICQKLQVNLDIWILLLFFVSMMQSCAFSKDALARYCNLAITGTCAIHYAFQSINKIVGIVQSCKKKTE